MSIETKPLLLSHQGFGVDGGHLGWRLTARIDSGVARPCSCRLRYELIRYRHFSTTLADWALYGNRRNHRAHLQDYGLLARSQHAASRGAGGSGILRDTACALLTGAGWRYRFHSVCMRPAAFSLS